MGAESTGQSDPTFVEALAQRVVALMAPTLGELVATAVAGLVQGVSTAATAATDDQLASQWRGALVKETAKRIVEIVHHKRCHGQEGITPQHLLEKRTDRQIEILIDGLEYVQNAGWLRIASNGTLVALESGEVPGWADLWEEEVKEA